MWYRLQRAVACSLAIIGLAMGAASAQAGWGHHWGHHHHHYYGSSFGWGYPSYGYSSLYISLPRTRLYYPSYSVGYYSNYYVPPVRYSVALPTYYAAPTYYVAPTYYSSPVVYPPSYSNCCDPCASSVNYPTSSPAYSPAAPTYSQPQYSTGLGVPDYPTPPQLASSSTGSFVDRMLNRIPANQIPANVVATNRTLTPTNVIPFKSNDGSVRTVSTLKPVAPSTDAPANLDQLTAIPDALLKTADEMFAIGGYEQAASAYARLAVRYGNHDELAVRRFIALVASGDHAQASIVFELAVANGRPLTSVALPTGGLARLYGANAQTRKNHIESLAAYALKADGEALPLNMVGAWLELDGQPERAATFLKRAAMISNAAEATASPTLANRLADAALAR